MTQIEPTTDLVEAVIRALTSADPTAATRSAYRGVARAAIAAVRRWDAEHAAPSAVPACHGLIWAGSSTAATAPCTLPLGHHGGCR